MANNPTTPIKIIEKLAKHNHPEVHAGLVCNPATPLKLAISFRTKGKYTTVNDSLSRNPNIAPNTLIDMYDRGEIGSISPSLNPSCPPELMWRLFNEGDNLTHTWLATNPNLPKELFKQLEQSSDPIVVKYLRTNPNYKSLKLKENS